MTLNKARNTSEEHLIYCYSILIPKDGPGMFSLLPMIKHIWIATIDEWMRMVGDIASITFKVQVAQTKEIHIMK
jgi:hypothetical protein